jgi:hypothetical protein
VGLDANGAHTRTTTTVRDAECLVEVQVAHVSTNLTRAGQTHLSLQPQQHQKKGIKFRHTLCGSKFKYPGRRFNSHDSNNTP